MAGTSCLCRSIAVLVVPFLAVAVAGEASAKPGSAWTHARVVVTAERTGDRLSPREPLAAAPMVQPDEHEPTIMLDKDKTFQTLIGIGGALTDASAETFYKLPATRREEILTAFFDNVKGIGFSLGRTHIHSCDFSSESYTYADSPGDTALASFSIQHDMKYRIPFIREVLARTGKGFTLFASPWSPPAWMKTNNDMLHGGTLRPEFRRAWARYVVKFVKAYEEAGIPLWGLTVQNEPLAVQPWESCIFTGEEERDFVRDYLGPILEEAGLSRLKLMIWDHNRGLMYQRAKAVYDDPAAAKYVWGTAFHWYVGDHFDNVALVRQAFPDKGLMFSEGTEAEFDAAHVGDWKWGETFGRAMIADLNGGANGWTVWNVILDERGGPNHAGNFCMAPIICNTTTGELTYMNSFFYMGHFSRYIRPGAKRIICSSNADELTATAFINPDNSIAVVVQNQTEKEVTFKTWMDGRAVQTESPAHSIVTLVLE